MGTIEEKDTFSAQQSRLYKVLHVHADSVNNLHSKATLDLPYSNEFDFDMCFSMKILFALATFQAISFPFVGADNYTDRIIAELAAFPTVTVCVADDEAGLAVFNATSQTYIGYEADVARLLLSDLEKFLQNETPLVANFVSPTLSERLNYVATQKCDFMIQLLTNTASRREVVAIGPPYLIIYEELLVYKDSGINKISDCTKASVAAGSVTTVNYETQFPDIEQVLTDNNEEGLILFLNGTVECMANDNVVFQALLEKIDDKEFEDEFPNVESSGLKRISTGFTFPPKPWSVATSFEAPLLMNELTAILAYANADGRLDELRKLYGFDAAAESDRGSTPSSSARPYTNHLELVALAVATVILL